MNPKRMRQTRVGLIMIIRCTGSAAFFAFYEKKDTTISDDALSLKIGSTAQDAVISSLSL